jgi:teichuronic acid biosynthesis glycosyltransferase TuaH
MEKLGYICKILAIITSVKSAMVNLIVFPFHSMRKNQKDGFRNRDGHFIESFAANPQVGKVVVVNRPTTFAEVVYARTTWKTKGKVIKSTSQARLVQVSEKLYSTIQYRLPFS